MTSDQITFSPRTDKKAVENENLFAPKFDENGLIPALAIDHETKQPLMLAYMNEESLKQTLALGEAVYYSRSRQELWHKGKTSGHTQTVHEIRTDCDQDALMVYVTQHGEGACHTGHQSCFYRKVDPLTEGQAVTLTNDGCKNFNPEDVYKK